MTEIAIYYCIAPECRRKFREADGRCVDCDYTADPEYAHLTLGAALPRLEGMGITGLTSAATRDDVPAALGPPHEAVGVERDPSLGYSKPWIKYYRSGCQLRFECGR